MEKVKDYEIASPLGLEIMTLSLSRGLRCLILILTRDKQIISPMLRDIGNHAYLWFDRGRDV